MNKSQNEENVHRTLFGKTRKILPGPCFFSFTVKIPWRSISSFPLFSHRTKKNEKVDRSEVRQIPVTSSFIVIDDDDPPVLVKINGRQGLGLRRRPSESLWVFRSPEFSLGVSQAPRSRRGTLLSHSRPWSMDNNSDRDENSNGILLFMIFPFDQSES